AVRLPPRRRARDRGRTHPRRQLSLLALQHEHGQAHHRDVRRGVRGAAAADRGLIVLFAVSAQDARTAALPVARLLGLALAFGDAELDLGAPALVEIDRQRNDGDAVALDPAEKTIELAAMQEE